jgi:hypothetical protein
MYRGLCSRYGVQYQQKGVRKCHNEMVPGRLLAQEVHEMEEVEAKVERRGEGAGRERAAGKGNARLLDRCDLPFQPP